MCKLKSRTFNQRRFYPGFNQDCSIGITIHSWDESRCKCIILCLALVKSSRQLLDIRPILGKIFIIQLNSFMLDVDTTNFTHDWYVCLFLFLTNAIPKWRDNFRQKYCNNASDQENKDFEHKKYQDKNYLSFETKKKTYGPHSTRT